MKTPRELLLERHRPMEAKLDDVSREALAAATSSGAETRNVATIPGLPQSPILQVLWRELIQPFRPVWLGLAATWLVILALNLDTAHPRQSAAAGSATPRPEVWAVLREQRQLLAQLLDLPEPPAPALPQPARPRSERREVIVIG